MNPGLARRDGDSRGPARLFEGVEAAPAQKT